MSSRWTLRLAGAGLLALALALVPHFLTRTESYLRYRDMEDQLGELEQGNDELRLKNRALRREIRRLKHDLGAIEAVARDELGLVRPGEIVIQIDQKPKVEEAQ